MDARNTIMTRAYVDIGFAGQSGFGYQDNLKDTASLAKDTPVSYMVVPKEGESANLTAAEIASGMRPEGAFGLSVNYGTEILVKAPVGFQGYGMDNVVSLRWDSPVDQYERSIVSGYHIERKLKSESEFKRITQTPVAISYSEDELGILYETPVFFHKKEIARAKKDVLLRMSWMGTERYSPACPRPEGFLTTEIGYTAHSSLRINSHTR
jgi:hypothetical protein